MQYYTVNGNLALVIFVKEKVYLHLPTLVDSELGSLTIELFCAQAINETLFHSTSSFFIQNSQQVSQRLCIFLICFEQI